MNYNELISRFEVFENPPKKDGYDRHHIVPESEQVKMHGSVIDQRQIYVSLPMHMWLHILYDREHGTDTAKRFLTVCNKPAEFFTCYELCLAYSYTLRKKREEGIKKLAEVKKTPEYRKKRSDVMKGKLVGKKNGMYGRTGGKNPFYGQHHTEETKKKWSEVRKGRKWWNNGIKNVMTYECPDGFVPGMLKRRAG